MPKKINTEIVSNVGVQHFAIKSARITGESCLFFKEMTTTASFLPAAAQHQLTCETSDEKPATQYQNHLSKASEIA